MTPKEFEEFQNQIAEASLLIKETIRFNDENDVVMLAAYLRLFVGTCFKLNMTMSDFEQALEKVKMDYALRLENKG